MEYTKLWFNDLDQWEIERNKLKDISDDDHYWSKDGYNNFIAFWFEDREEGWIRVKQPKKEDKTFSKEEVIKLFEKFEKDRGSYYAEDAVDLLPLDIWLKENL